NREPPSPPIGAIVGSTATGKTELALAVAETVAVEILVADSRQVYRGMDIGTAKPDAAARMAVPHHLLDLAAPDEPFSVADWLIAAGDAVSQVAGRGRLPLLVGGSGLYVAALLDGYDLGATPSPAAIRADLDTALVHHGLPALAARLVALDPVTAAATDLRNPRRVVRALERAQWSGGAAPRPQSLPWPGEMVQIGLHRPRVVLDDRIAKRAAALFAGGLLSEVRQLLDAGYGPDLPPMTGHGYAEAARFLVGEWSLDEAIAVTVRRTRQYARRQETWFRRDRRIQWFDAGSASAADPDLVRRAAAALGVAAG
ncbi:MAG: tRNA (adenosine(37)-N6)-dimethylallyltransferase MiaA, partial [Chloroflexota bacterium]|nr:tRNA (adenosine(37)-N6)-dimethylallyltransferase MiaA [Chloroflexota bacterium]